MRPLGQQPNQVRPNGSISFRQSITWQRRKWKIRSIKIRFCRYFDDNHYILHTHHAWPSQMHENLLIFVHLWGPVVMGPYNKLSTSHWNLWTIPQNAKRKKNKQTNKQTNKQNNRCGQQTNVDNFSCSWDMISLTNDPLRLYIKGVARGFDGNTATTCMPCKQSDQIFDQSIVHFDEFQNIVLSANYYPQLICRTKATYP